MSKNSKDKQKEKEEVVVKPELTSSFSYKNFTAPFFTTNNFNITYSFLDRDEIVNTDIDGNAIHASLKAASDDYRTEYVKLYDSKTARKELASANILNGEIGFLYSKNGPEEGYLGDMEFEHFSIRVPITTAQYTFTVPDFFDHAKDFNAEKVVQNKSLRNRGFNAQLQQRIDLAKACAPFTLSADLTGKLHVHNSQFHETYHHTEQGCMHFLDSGTGTKFVVDKVMAAKPAFVSALFLDLHSTRYMCGPCNVGLVGLQNTQEGGWLKNLQNALRKKHVELPADGLTLNTRMSADMPANGQATLHTTRDIESRPQVTAKDRSLILQGDSGQAKLKTIIEQRKYSLDTFSGDFFTSREIAKKKMETKLGGRACFE